MVAHEANVHPSAFVENGARLGAGVTIGPMCYVGSDVVIGENTVLTKQVVVTGHTTVGARTMVHPFAVLGGPPQHVHHKNEPTKLDIGDDVIIREHVTMNAGTVSGGGLTKVGDRGFFMAGAHVAHDCYVGSDAIFANNATLGGHVRVGDSVFLGGLCAIHQNCRIGDFAFIGGCAAVVADIIPYASAFGNHAHLEGLNIIGMKRRGMKRESIHNLRAAYRLLFESDGLFKDRVEQVHAEYGSNDDVMRILNFIQAKASRPLMTAACM